jgi:4-hydroxy-tetrahydrodipicolinate synthase
VHAATFPVIRAMGRVGGVVFSKAALRLRGIDVGDPRLPLPPATPEQVTSIADDLAEAGVPLARAHDVLARPDASAQSRTPKAGSAGRTHDAGSAGSTHDAGSAGSTHDAGSAGREAEVPVS